MSEKYGSTPTVEMRFHIFFAGLLLLGAVIFFPPIRTIGELVFEDETFSHIPLIPVISLFLLAAQRKCIFTEGCRRSISGFSVCVFGLALYGIAAALRDRLDSPALRGQAAPNDYLTLCMAGAVVWVIGSFIAAFGRPAFKHARFALLFLAFAVPLPTFFLNAVVSALQLASVEAADIVFKLTGVAYHRTGMVFELPNVAVQVAEQCSGIRSSLALFILSVITGYLFLGTFSRRLILALSIFPITVAKNAFRIVTITLLANYVDIHFLTDHWIHRSGGIPFFAVALAMFIPLVWFLRRSELRMAH